MRGGTLFDDCMSRIHRQMLPLKIFSLAVNLLLLVSSIYMLQVV
jgi:ABC-type protease/lipase transport system fused ATPase/permease subunit